MNSITTSRCSGSALSPTTITRSDAVPIGWSAVTACWKIKAPLPHTQVEYWLSGRVNERFWPQLQGQLYVSQRRWVDILCWHDVLPKVVMRVEPDAAFIEALDRELRSFNLFIECVME